MNWSDSGRLQLFWDSPIIAGTMFAALAPWANFFLVQTGRPSGHCRIVAVIWEMLAIVGCALTQSRGPLLALFTANLAGVCLHRRLASDRWFFWRGLAAAALVAGLAFLPGTAERVLAPFSSSDASIQNRLVIWRSACDALFLHPVSGIGPSQAGYCFSQWYQSEAGTYRYTGIFNEYLQLGVERGVPVLLLALSLVALVALVPRALPLLRSDEKPWFAGPAVLGAYLSALVLAVSGLFSIVSEVSAIRLVGLADLTILLACVGGRFHGSAAIRRPGYWPAGAFAAALSCVTLVWGLHRLQPPRPIKIEWCGPNLIRVSKVPKKGKPVRSAAFLADQECLGRLYGKEIRRWLVASEELDEFLVFDPRYPVSRQEINSCPTVILTGKTARFARLIEPGRVQALTFIHPSAAWVDLGALKVPATVYAPKISDDGLSLAAVTALAAQLNVMDSGATGGNLQGLKLNLSP